MSKLVTLLNEVYTKEAAIVNENNSIFLDGIFMEGDVKNNNGRLYPGAILQREAAKFSKLVQENRALGELDHPDQLSINLDRVSHFIKELKQVPHTSQWSGRLQLMNTPMGSIARSLVEAGVKLAISSRGVGSFKEDVTAEGAKIVDEDYNLITYDLVHSPGAPNAFLGIKESREFVFENGMYIPVSKMLPEYDCVKDTELREYSQEIVKFLRTLGSHKKLTEKRRNIRHPFARQKEEWLKKIKHLKGEGAEVIDMSDVSVNEYMSQDKLDKYGDKAFGLSMNASANKTRVDGDRELGKKQAAQAKHMKKRLKQRDKAVAKVFKKGFPAKNRSGY